MKHLIPLRLLISCSTVIATSDAAKNDLVPIEDFFKAPLVSNVSISPDGEYIAFKFTKNDIKGLSIYNLDTNTINNWRGYSDDDVHDFYWTGNDYVIFNLIKDNLYTNGLYAAPRKKGKLKLLNKNDYLNIVAAVEDDSNTAFAWSSTTDTLISFDIKHAEGNAVKFDVPGKVLDWEISQAGVVRTALTYHQNEEHYYHYSTDTEQWEKIEIPDEAALSSYSFEGYEESKNAYWVVGYHGDSATGSLHLFDVKTKTLSDVIYQDDYYDIVGNLSLVRSRESNELIGLQYDKKGPGMVWINPYYTRIQAMINQTLPGLANLILEFDRSENRIVVFSYSDREPGIYSVFDLEKAQIIFQHKTRPWLDRERLSKQYAIKFVMQDDLQLEGFLTLPGPEKEGPYPMVTLAHGGPWARDYWSFDEEVQFLASRGYAVLQLNFRGSTGYNRTIATKYSGDFKTMVRDLSDATRTAVRKGWADPDRLAIMGTSFGGYAAVASATFDPELYQCAISIAGTFNIEEQMKNWKSDYWKERQGTAAYDSWLDMIGDPKEKADYIYSISPIYHVDNVEAPILLLHGKEDMIVSQKQSKQLAQGLRAAGKECETHYFSFEGHGFSTKKSKIKAYSAIEEFLAKHIPSSGQPDSSD